MSEKRYAIIGHPILHSKSPQIHNHWFRENNLSANYSRIIANDVYVALGMGYKLGLTGANVTAPFKEKVIPSLVYLSPEAAAVGAVNTLIYNGPNISGYNTDVTGVIRAFQINNVELKHKSLLVIGAGGAARAIVSALKPSGAEITIVNRPDEMALNLARSFQVKSVPFSEIQTAVRTAEIIVTALPPGVRVVEPEWLNSRQIIMDANYKNSEMEPLAQAVGARFISGIVWLTEQARPAFELFTGIQPASDIPPAIIDGNPYAGKSNVILTGFMGAGKSTLGPLLAERLGWQFVDVDQVIIESAGKSINAIFKDEGEDEFRRLESQALAKILESQNQVIAGGGGIILSEINRALICQKALSIWLFARPLQIWPRIEQAGRPLLKSDDPLATAEQIFRTRSDLYFNTADGILDTEVATPETCTDLLYAEISQIFHD